MNPPGLWEVLRNRQMSRGTIAGRARLKAPIYADQFPSSLQGTWEHLCSRRVRGHICSPQSSQAPCIVSCVPHSPSEGAAPSPELAPTHSLPLPQCATACSSCGALNLGSPQPNKLNLSPKGAWAAFYKQRLHKSCLSPSRLTLFSLPPHLLLAKWLNSFSIYCGSLKPKPGAWGRMQNSSALWPLPSGGAGNCLLPLLCNPARSPY